MPTSQTLPPQPSLEQLKKQAKTLLKAHQSGNHETISRLRSMVPKLALASDAEILAAKFSLLDAQFVIAREYGYDSWNPFALALLAETHKDKEFVQGAFGHNLSPAVVDHIVSNPDMISQLDGEERVMTAFFSDIARFSTISQCLTPTELVNFLNEYLSEMCDIIEKYNGTIDKFEGDAIVAFFGAPIYFEDHALRATLACIDQQKKLVELRRRWKADASLPPSVQQLWKRWEEEGLVFVKVRMGMASGPMVVGNMGSRNRPDYTMMGDTVNLAARFESGQKIYGTSIMVNEVIYEQVQDQVETRKLDLIKVLGQEEPVTAYEVLDRKGELSPEKCEVLELYAQGMKAYEAFHFAEAQDLFERALQADPQDGPSTLYVDRCKSYAVAPPADLIFRA